METVKSLRQKGYKVRVFHSRLVVESEEDEITTRGLMREAGPQRFKSLTTRAAG